MKVLQINTRYYNGGSTGRITFDLKKVMEANGVESYAAFGFGYEPKESEVKTVYRIESDRELLISKLWTKTTGHHGFNKIGFVSPERRYEAPTVGTLGMCIV